jgi:hypothetical protein
MLSSSFQIFGNPKYVIGVWPAGFFASYISVLNHLMWCEKNKKIPVVLWNEKSFYFQKEGFNGSLNVWEYYFEPVSSLNYTYHDKIHKKFYADKIYFTGWTIDKATRQKANFLINKYIKIKPIVQKKIDNFYNKFMKGKKTIGIHLRGTDKFQEEPKVPVWRILQEANKFADGKTQFFIASDDIKLFEEVKKGLNGNVIYTDSIRSSSTSKEFWVMFEKNRAKLGEEVLIDACLLARCDKFIHTYSSVSTSVLFMNPNLEDILLVKDSIVNGLFRFIKKNVEIS